jgi:signal peptidase I
MSAPPSVVIDDGGVPGKGDPRSPRKPWLAFLLSLLLAGTGQLYNGRVAKSVLFVLGIPLLAFPILWLAMNLPVRPVNVLLPWTILPGLQILSAVEASRDARRLRELPRPWYGGWRFCAGFLLLNVFIILPVWRSVLLSSCVQSFKIPSGGMETTVLIGDHFLVSRSAYGFRLPYSTKTIGRREPERGDIIAFLFPEDRRRVFLKRVIGLPGETVEVRDRTVYVNHRPLEEPYATYLDLPAEQARYAAKLPTPSWGPETVPPGMLFVLGDNRDNSRDSRFWGFLPIGDVLGPAKVVYFSWDADEKRVRWERIGHRLH